MHGMCQSENGLFRRFLAPFLTFSGNHRGQPCPKRDIHSFAELVCLPAIDPCGAGYVGAGPIPVHLPEGLQQQIPLDAFRTDDRCPQIRLQGVERDACGAPICGNSYTTSAITVTFIVSILLAL